MSPLTTKTQRSARLFDKEFYGDKIAEKLNGAKPSPSVLRVRTLIERLKAFSEKSAKLEFIHRERELKKRVLSSPFEDWAFCDYDLSDPEVSTLAEQANKIAEDLSSSLRRYRWRPDVQVNRDGTMSQFIHWPSEDEESDWENETVSWLISGFPTSPQSKGLFTHFIHCQRCGNWFYAGRDGAKFCKEACRVMSHAQTEEGKAAKALYMRNLRQTERKRKRKQGQSRPRLPVPQVEDAQLQNTPKGRRGRT